MGLILSQRQAVTKTIAARYKRASKVDKTKILDELCATTGWHRSHARKALSVALKPKVVVARRPRPPIYGPEVVEALRFCWAVLGAPTGKRLAPAMGMLVATLRRFSELDIDDHTAGALRAMSAATIDRRLAPARAAMTLKGRSHTKPGSLLKDSIPIRTWAQWDDAVPGFVEIDLVGHEGGNAVGEHCYTLTVTDIATGWTENRSVPNKARKWVVAALEQIAAVMPFPLLGVDSDNGSEFINHHLFAYCADRHITFTRGRPYRKNDSARVEQKNWAVVRQAVGYARFDTDAELAVLAELYSHLRLLTNFFIPQARLVTKTRDGAKVVRRYDTPATPYRRVLDAGVVSAAAAKQLTTTYRDLNPAQLRRDVAVCQRRLRELGLTKIRPA